MKVSANDIATLLASPAPRAVPEHVMKVARTGGGRWVGAIFGLFFAAFGMIFVYVFFPWRITDELQLKFGSTGTASGVILHVEKTSMSVNDEEVFANQAGYSPEGGGGPRLITKSYTSGAPWKEGAPVTVRFLQSKPAVACIEGARLTLTGLWGAVVIIFPLMGFAVLFFSIAGGRRGPGWLLQNGQVAEVDVLGVDATNMRINYQTVYKIRISAPDGRGGPPLVFRRWGKGDINLLTQHALKKQPAFALYDPAKPKNILFPEALIQE